MKCKAVVSLAAMFLIVASVSSADGGAALFKSKCAACHGASGEGKAAIQAPALKGTSLDVSQITAHITKGESTSKAPTQQRHLGRQ